MSSQMKRFHKIVFVISIIVVLSSCGGIKQDFADDLSATIVSFDDPETVRKGVPAYLILISTMIKGDPEDVDLLESGARLYSAYASSFTDSQQSKIALANRAYEYASRAICLTNETFCNIGRLSYFEFEQKLGTLTKDDVRHLFVFASSWASKIEANSSDWNAIADLPKVKAAIQRVLDLDDTIDNGNAHLYMAVMETLLPPSMGGKPEIAKQHFEAAIRISGGQNQMAKVLYAEKYARLLFDRKLHDRLLKEVIASGNDPDQLKLINALARQKAQVLLDSADDYF
jgi:hypothetical protein